MFKAARIMQAAMVLTLAGCASKPNISAPLDNAQLAPLAANQEQALKTADTSPQSPQQTRQTSEKKRISVPIIQGSFVNADGKLNPDILQFAQFVSESRSIPLDHVVALLSEAQENSKVQQLMRPSKQRIRRSWPTYRKRFVDPIRIDAGLNFWQEHANHLQKTAERYGVPEEVIVAIIGVETIYGRYMGDFRVLDAISTLAFRYPDASRSDRIALFRDQLADLIELDYKNALDARTAYGSYAGAMGLPQFMPGSLLRYAVDGSGDGKIDLQNNAQDAISSVANFLIEHGWQPGLPIFAPVLVNDNVAQLVDGGLSPTLDWETLKQAGVQEQTSTRPASWKYERMGIVDLLDEPRQQAEYRVGTPNFFAITHYNRSYFYASAVAELAEALAKRMKTVSISCQQPQQPTQRQTGTLAMVSIS